MRFREFATERVNLDVFEPGTRLKKVVEIPGIGPVTLTLEGKPKSMNIPYIQIMAYAPDGDTMGYFRFHAFKTDPEKNIFGLKKSQQPEPYVGAGNINVYREYQRRGVATAVYQWLRELGNDIRPSTCQTDQGRAMWSGFEKKHSLAEGTDFTNAVNSVEKLIKQNNIKFNSYEDLLKFVANRKFLQAQRNDQRFINDVARSVLRRLHTVTEVIKMPPTKNSSQGMADWAYNDAKNKNARQISSLKDIPTEVYDMGDHLRVFVLDNQGPVLYLALDKFLDGFKSGAVAVDPRGRGKNLAVQVYQAVSNTYNRPIYSDTTQTDASRIGIWQKLIQVLPDRVVGYDQRTKEDLPLTHSDSGPVVRNNQPIYTQRKSKDQPKPVPGETRSRTRLLKLLPALSTVNEVRSDDDPETNYYDADDGFEELKVSERIRKYFYDRGYQYLGEGRDQMAFLTPRETVLKVLGIGEDQREDIVKTYVGFFMRNQRNPHYPRIYNAGDFTVDGESYFLYEMEYLNPLSGEERVLDYIEGLMRALPRGEHALDAFYKNNQRPPELGEEQVDGLVYATQDLEDAIGGHAPLDLSSIENLGRRDNGQIVIIDPFSL